MPMVAQIEIIFSIARKQINKGLEISEFLTCHCSTVMVHKAFHHTFHHHPKQKEN